jgi:hypothetical protein
MLVAKKLRKRDLDELSSNIDDLGRFLRCPFEEAKSVVETAIAAGECEREAESVKSWIDNRFVPNTVFIDHLGYAEMCINALRTVPSITATDFGSSRQRDLGQLWADMTRGYLGELAVKRHLESKFGLTISLGHELGDLEEFLNSDIKDVTVDGVTRPPNVAVGIKTMKMNALWLDIPNAQFLHSDFHVSVKVKAPRDHLFSFFKSISVFKDKILKLGTDNELITAAESDRIYTEIPDFGQIAGYVCGFVPKNATYRDLDYTGRMGSKNFTVTKWNGPLRDGDFELIRTRESAARVQLEGIGQLSHDQGYLFNSGSLLWQDKDWDQLVSRL